ncbi:hypothetical protein ElyMa_004697500 [Elysia marginata]|uniref:Uncharacterized protein n=1 Tax=Elysia marginata TaxID=1093978 RepID=A0AAV4I710_9GAST|nr:hypothetical protein ElyMa_004697500 [Elysia marginata]
MSPGWSQVPKALGCAHRSLREFPQARGYLYNEVTGLCTPVLYLGNPNEPGARQVEAWEGTLYLATEVCGNGFEAILFHVSETWGTNKATLQKLQSFSKRLFGTKPQNARARNHQQYRIVAKGTATTNGGGDEKKKVEMNWAHWKPRQCITRQSLVWNPQGRRARGRPRMTRRLETEAEVANAKMT